jgi:hypothetical protein
MMMKRAVSFVLFGLGTAVLFGCPIYPADRDHRVCIGGDCYDCPDSYYSGACNAWTCNSGADCPSGYSCNSDHRCKFTDGDPNNNPGDPACTKPADCPSGNCGADNKCHAGDCSTTGCPSSFVCRLSSGSNGVAACVPIGGDGGGGTSSCKSDKDCPSPAGSKCLTGACVPPQDQCVDATQCPGEAQCVQGACTPSCNQNKPCPTGYGCDLGKGVCTQNPTPCTTNSQCTGGKLCVQEHCVEGCGAGGTCGAGLKCIDGGCTPDQQPVFTCATDGAQDNCQAGSICLRHSCYIGCDADAGTEACKNADNFNQCKPVTTSSGTHNVCGSTTNLGSDCDPTQNKNCVAPAICIDGYCK